jgi:hypothetical protein
MHPGDRQCARIVPQVLAYAGQDLVHGGRCRLVVQGNATHAGAGALGPQLDGQVRRVVVMHRLQNFITRLQLEPAVDQRKAHGRAVREGDLLAPATQVAGGNGTDLGIDGL